MKLMQILILGFMNLKWWLLIVNDVIMMIVQDIENMLDSKKLGFIQCTTSNSVTYNFNGVDYKIKVDEIKGGVDNG